MKLNYVICYYDEIGIKEKNRKYFEKILVENIFKTLSDNFSKEKLEKLGFKN